MQPALRPREEAKRKSLPTLRTLVLNADYRPAVCEKLPDAL